MTPKNQKILLAAGGTGGHVFPMLAVAEALEAQGNTPHLIVDQRTEKLLSDHWRAHATVLNIPPPSAGKLKQLIGLAKAFRQCRCLLRTHRIKAVGCFGGYPAAPAGLAAITRQRPLLIHEQNAVMGKTNRRLSPFAKVIATSYSNTTFAKADVMTGNPVREGIEPVDYILPDETLNILVTGGSLGATIFADIVPKAIALLPANLRANVRLTQQCRAEDLEAVQAQYHAMDVEADCAPFFDDLPLKIALSQLVIARAGASTLAELATIGRPAILVPYPHAAHDHQRINAEATPGTWMLLQDDFTPEALAERLERLLIHTMDLTIAAEQIQARESSKAAGEIAERLRELI